MATNAASIYTQFAVIEKWTVVTSKAYESEIIANAKQLAQILLNLKHPQYKKTKEFSDESVTIAVHHVSHSTLPALFTIINRLFFHLYLNFWKTLLVKISYLVA